MSDKVNGEAADRSGRGRRAENTIADGRSQRPESASDIPRADPTVPNEIDRRYVRQGNKRYFPDNTIAFEDRGDRLIARTENATVIRDLIAIAEHRGWHTIQVGGSETFRLRAVREAHLHGLQVQGVSPAAPQSNRSGAGSYDAAPHRTSAEPLHGKGAESANVNSTAVDAGSARGRPPVPRPGDRLSGRLLAAGTAPFRFHPRNRESFFIRIETSTGSREIWGTDLRRALHESETRPKLGDRVVVEFRGTRVVNVPVDAQTGSSSERRQNLWRVEKPTYFDRRDAAAKVLREDAPAAPNQSSKTQPPLREAQLILQAARLFAREKISSEDDRSRFERALRRSLAGRIERGESLPALRMRAPAPEGTRTGTRTAVPRLLDPTHGPPVR